MEERRSKRARISLACVSCREHKTRCDGETPLCGCCQRRAPQSQTPCVYQNQAQSRESKEIQTLQQRVHQLEEELVGAKSTNSGLGTGGFGSNGQSPSSSGQAFQRGGAEIRPLSDTVHVPNSNEAGGTAFDESNDQVIFANGSISRMPPTSVSGPSMARPSNAGSDVHLQRESFLGGLRPYAINDNIQTTEHGTPQGNDEPYFYGESSTTTLMQEVHDIISPSARGDLSSNADPSRGEPSIYSAPDHYPRREESIRNVHSNYLTVRNHMNDFDLPPRPLADHLLDSYFNRVNILYPFLHRPTFEAAYEKLWAPRDADGRNGRLNSVADAGLGNSTNSGPESRVFYVGINAIFALSCQYSDLPISKAMEAAKGYLERAMALLLHAELLDNPSISLVQVLLLLCLHLQSTPLRNRLWNVIGMAFRMAQGLALQMDDGEALEKTKSNLEIEMRRRIWYGCVMLDMTVSMTLGRTPMTSSGYTIPFPQAINDENLTASTSLSSPSLPQPPVGISPTSFFIEAIKLSGLTDKMLKALYPDPTTRGKIIAIGHNEGEKDSAGGFDVVMNLETMWTRLYVNLPPELRWPRSGTNLFDRPSRPAVESSKISRCLERQQNVLHTRFLYVKILLYRPLFLRLCRQRIPQQTQNPHVGPFQQQEFQEHDSPEFDEDSATVRSYFATRCSIECFRTAEELIGLVHITHRTNAASAWWYNLFYAYTSGIVVILTRFCPPLTDILDVASIDKSWVLCQEILKDMAIYGNHAKRCLGSLQDLRSRLASWETGPPYSLHETQNLAPFANRMNYDQSTPNAIYPNSQSHTHGDTLSGREDPSTSNNGGLDRESEVSNRGNPLDVNSIPAAPGHHELVAGADWAGSLPWDVDFDHWWTFDTVGADFGPVSGSEATYF